MPKLTVKHNGVVKLTARADKILFNSTPDSTWLLRLLKVVGSNPTAPTNKKGGIYNEN